MFEKIDRNDLWSDQVVRYGYIRKIYPSKLERYLDNNLEKVLLGQYRGGESQLLRMLIHHLMTQRDVPARNMLVYQCMRKVP